MLHTNPLPHLESLPISTFYMSSLEWCVSVENVNVVGGCEVQSRKESFNAAAPQQLLVDNVYEEFI